MFCWSPLENNEAKVVAQMVGELVLDEQNYGPSVCSGLR